MHAYLLTSVDISTYKEPSLAFIVPRTFRLQAHINSEDEICSNLAVITGLKGTLSTVWFCLQTMFALPISPEVENLTPSLVTEMTTAE